MIDFSIRINLEDIIHDYELKEQILYELEKIKKVVVGIHLMVVYYKVYHNI